ncbi:hypothetical protein LPJ78_003794 [Coemansia sp. RSA 989]|nr:hypothetical protein LPJ79_000286 [Coemansia sp. RSA 1821]KAJ1863791.1 hypothetical protein LPJ78_003794 [Coemansia sp. RSA 989]KAJ1872226.1 hypothetical protein LPJ55_003246 [Coemansia sp. RSA 990]KAJ2676582.1 hypothetical protein IWW42_000457 [Coemansia sp. RSA 1085]
MLDSNSASQREAGRIPSLRDQFADNHPTGHDQNAFDDILSVVNQNYSKDEIGNEAGTKEALPRFGSFDADEPSLKDADMEIDEFISSIGKEDTAAPVRPRDHGNVDSGDANEDLMNEFEQILADMAGSDTKAYKSAKPAPLFWSESEIDKTRPGESSFLDKLSPESLFKGGLRSSAFSAGKLVGDPNQISSLAKRVQELSRSQKKKAAKTNILQENSDFVTRNSLEDDQRLERAQLGALATCFSVPDLSKFVFNDLISRKASIRKGLIQARPSPVVYAEVIRISRDLKAPSIGLYLYDYCRTRMKLYDRLRVLNNQVYSELLTLVWRCKRDISAVLMIMQDIVAMGVVGGRDMERQIDQIVVELTKIYNMPNIADLVGSLRKKITFSTRASIEN